MVLVMGNERVMGVVYGWYMRLGMISWWYGHITRCAIWVTNTIWRRSEYTYLRVSFAVLTRWVSLVLWLEQRHYLLFSSCTSFVPWLLLLHFWSVRDSLPDTALSLSLSVLLFLFCWLDGAAQDNFISCQRAQEPDLRNSVMLSIVSISFLSLRVTLFDFIR